MRLIYRVQDLAQPPLDLGGLCLESIAQIHGALIMRPRTPYLEHWGLQKLQDEAVQIAGAIGCPVVVLPYEVDVVELVPETGPVQ